MRTVAALLLTATLTACGADSATPRAEPSDSPTASPTPSATPTPTVHATDLADGKHYARVTAFDSGGRTLTVDVVQFLTGPQYDNDYSIRNDNPRLRTLTIAADLKVVVNTLAFERNNSSTKDTVITHAELAAYLDEGEAQRRVFWFTVQDGVVTTLHEQFLP